MARNFLSGLPSDLLKAANNKVNSAMVQSAMSTGTDKKALVIFYLEGGLDCHNFLSPANTASPNRTYYMNARSSLSVPVDNTKQTLISTEWQLHPRMAGMQQLSPTSVQIPITGPYADSTIATQLIYNRSNTTGIITTTWTNHGLNTGDYIYADFVPYSNTTTQVVGGVFYPTDGRYQVTVTDASNFYFTPSPLITNAIGGEQNLTNQFFIALQEKRTTMGTINAGDATILMNIGPLVYPLYKNRTIDGIYINDYPSEIFSPQNTKKTEPLQLSSHSDQRVAWFTARPDASSSATGWAGRLMDLVNPAFNTNTNIPSSFTLRGPNVTLYQNILNTADLLPTGVSSRSKIDQDNLVNFDDTVLNKMNYSNPMMLNYIQAQRTSVNNTICLGNVYSSGPNIPTTPFNFIASPNSYYQPLENLNTIIRMIRGMFNDTNTNLLGNVSQRRQVYFFKMNNFDQHDGLIEDFDPNLINVSKTIVKFMEAVNETPEIANNTVMMVFSEFGRSFIGNADGSDHGWGGHAMLIGKPVNGFGKSKSANGVTYIGKKYYGTSPNLNYISYSSTNTDMSRTNLIPTLAVDTLYSTIAQWFGVPDGWYDAAGNIYTAANAAIINASSPGSIINPLEIVLPNLPNFTPNTAQGIFAPLWATDTGDSHRLIPGLLKDYTFGQ